MSAHAFRPLTWRVENIPEGTSSGDLLACFHTDDQAFVKVKSLCPSVETPEGEDGDLTATVFFNPPNAVEMPPRIVTDDMMNIDKEFFGFTPLYVPPPGTGPIVADIIAVTGLAGHAFGSWAHSHERMWLRDYIPKDVPNTRVLTYGYPSKLQASTSVSILQDHTNTFVHRLIDMRESAQCESRPIIFVGHSLGCLIIKKALTGVENMGIARSRLPVRAFIFLGAPHRGLNVTALQTLVKGEPPSKLIAELEADSATLTDLNQGFAHVAKDIDILTCYETRSTKTAINVNGEWKREGPAVMMVSPNSAQQYYLKEKCVSVDADHSQIAKIKRGQNGVYPNVKSAIKHGLISTAKIVAGVDSGLDPVADIEKDFANVNVMENTALPSQPPPYSPDLTAKTTPVRPPPPRASSSSMVSSSAVLEPGSENLISFDEDGRNTRTLRSNTRSSVGAESLNDLSRSSTATSIGSEGPALHNNAIFANVGRSEPLSNVPVQGVANGPAKKSNPIEFPNSEKCIVQCDVCQKNVSHDEFHFRCDDCAVDELDDVHDDDEIDDMERVDEDDNGNIKSRDKKVNAKKSDDDKSENEDDMDDSYDVCQKCFFSGLQGLEHAGHKFGKMNVVFYGDDIAVLPYPERQVFMHDSGIVKALKEGDSAKLVDAIHNGDNINAYDTEGNAPLHFAIQLGLAACVNILLDAGAAREIRDRAEMTPLLTAVQYNQVEIVGSLIEKGADINATGTKYNDTALHLAALNGQSNVVRILLANRPVINAMSTVGTPLLYAAMRGRKQAANLLLVAGANPNLQLECEDTAGPPLLGAASAGKIETVDLLILYGARIEDCDDDGYTALMLAAANGKLKFCEKMLQKGASVRTATNDGRTALALAAEQNERDIVELLLKHGADIEQPDNDGSTPLVLAMLAEEEDMVKFLRRKGAQINKLDANGDSPLMKAVRLNKPDVVATLLKNGAKVDTPDGDGETPLIYGTIEGWVEVCEQLLIGKADVDQYTTSGDTPLMKATKCNKPEIVRLLLQHDASVDKPENTNDETPLMYAAIEGYTEICEALLLGKADVNRYHPNGSTALYKAVVNNKPDVVEILLKYGAAVDLPNSESAETPLLYGLLEEFVEVCEILLRYKANIEQVTQSSNTPLMAAAMAGKLESVKLLTRYRPQLDRMPARDGWTALTLAAHAGHVNIVEHLLICGASGFPPPTFGKWKNFVFKEGVDSRTQSRILQTLREYKYRS